MTQALSIQKNVLNPETIFLSNYSKNSQITMLKSLKQIVKIITNNDNVNNFPWSKLIFPYSTRIRSILQEQVDNKQISSNTANLRLSALKGILKVCWQMDLINTEQFHRSIDFKSIHGQTIISGKHIETQIVQNIIKFCINENKKISIRDASIISMLFGTGMRRSEIVSLKMNDLKDNYILITGKGNKQRICYLPAKTIELLNNWLLIRGKENGPIFCQINRFNKLIFNHFSSQVIEQIINKRIKQIGGTKISPHDFRRTFIGNLLDNNIDISTVSQMVGHSNVKTTAKYDKRNDSRKEIAISKIIF